MRPAGVALALCGLTGCFSDTPPQLTGVEPSTGGATTSTATTSTTAEPTSTTTTTGTTDALTTTGTTGPCPMGQPETAWYVDGDGDGWGVEPPVFACDPPPGAIAVGGDCDDAAFEINPGVFERCNDLVDDDCDGLLDEYSPDNLECGGCRLSEFGGAAYWVCPQVGPFLAAEAQCQLHGAAVHLANPVNPAELAFVRDRIVDLLGEIPDALGYWLGIHRQEALWSECSKNPEARAWVALDGQPVGYLPWSDGEPNNLNCVPLCMPTKLDDPKCPRENCVEIDDGPTGAYNDVICFKNNNGHVCKAPL